jgi:hypothetical protein
MIVVVFRIALLLPARVVSHTKPLDAGLRAI